MPKLFWLVAPLCVVLVSTHACAQSTHWETSTDAGLEAQRQGRYGEAEEHFSAALKEAENFGPEDHRLATSLSNLAELYRGQGKYAEAEPFYQRTLAILEKALGPEHPYVATSLSSLGVLYATQGKYAEAEPLHKRSLAIREKALGPDHPNVAASLENYAKFLRHMNRGAEATDVELRAKAIREKYPPSP